MANRVLTELEKAPLPDIVRSLAVAIGEAQFALDLNSIERLKLMANADKGITLPNEDDKRSLLELGLVPSFYHFTEATIEARVAFSMTTSHEVSVGMEANFSVPTTVGIFGASISASYTNKYSFSAEGSSVISTKLVSVPPPDALTRIVSQLTERKS